MNEIQKIAQQVAEQEGWVHKEINGKQYKIVLLNARTAWTLCERIIQFAAPVVGAFMDDLKAFESSVWLEIGSLVAANLGELNIPDLADVLLQGATCNGVAIKVDDFRGAKGLSELKQVTEWALNENVLDFLSEWLGQEASKIQSKMEQMRSRGVELS